MKIRVIVTLAGLLLIMFGFVGFFMGVENTAVGRVGRFYDQVPLHEISGIVVDSSGNIFVGSSNHNSIQVYDNTGAFLYRFSFPAGYFSFYIDSEDIVHVAVARGGGVLSFNEGYLVGERRPLSVGGSEINEFRNLRRRQYVDNSGNIYNIQLRSVRMYDEYENFIRRISLNAPIWPLAPFMTFGIAWLGIGMVVFPNLSFFVEVSRAAHPEKKSTGQKS